MERILRPEYLRYEEGFFDGKDDCILALYSQELGEEVEEYFFEEDEFEEDEWYNKGYEDATKYFYDRYEKIKNIELMMLTENENIIDKLFVRRVIEYNIETNEQIPIGIFHTRLSLKR